MAEPQLFRSQADFAVDPTDEPMEGFVVNALKELDAVSFLEFLDQDSRPTFVLDLDSDHVDHGETKQNIRPVFCNAALRSHGRLLDSVTGATNGAGLDASTSTSHAQFKSWATGVSKFDDSHDVFPQTFLYADMLWTGSTTRRRWRLLSGIRWYGYYQHAEGTTLVQSPHQDTSAAVSKKDLTRSTLRSSEEAAATATVPASELQPKTPTAEHELGVRRSLTWRSTSSQFPTDGRGTGASYQTSKSGSSISLASVGNSVTDWTAASPRGILTEHMIFARHVDWVATPLGPMDGWSAQFREVANVVMMNPHPAALLWGEELTMLYNEAYKNEVAGNKHPDLMGTGFSGPFKELWETLAPVFQECARTGRSIRKENDCLFIERYGYLEETFFSWSWTPIYGGTKRMLGFYHAPFETTYQTISHRRLQTLRKIGEKLSEVRSMGHFWQSVLEGLQDNPYEAPFALVYSITDSNNCDPASQSYGDMISTKTCSLEGAIGIPDGHPALIPGLDLKRSNEGFVPAFREVLRIKEPMVLHKKNGSLPEELNEGIEWRGYGDPCQKAIVLPVRHTNGENVFAFLVLGLNPRRAYDDEYKAFVYMLDRLFTNALASYLLFEEEIRKNRNAAEAAQIQREQLSQELELQANRMRRMTELSPLGMYLLAPNGALVEANERFYEMTGHGRYDDTPFAFMYTIAEECRTRAEQMWASLMTDPKARQEELRLIESTVKPEDLSGDPIDCWVLATSQPELGADGKVRSIMGSIADISHLKWVQGLQDQRLKDAEEMKRQQNEFIDVTSHEMRNPLSAVLICADAIRDSLSQHPFAVSDVKVIEECIEAANNIALCVQHQKSIVDDILTVSKLDSNLLLITPVAVQPTAIIRRAMSMFKPEMQAKDIGFSFHPHESLTMLDVDWINIDPSRLLQITVNLITNAIKFTAASHARFISIHLAASMEQPLPQEEGFEYVPTRSSLADITAGEDWGGGERLYISVSVHDTGCGLTPEGKRVLFERFAQASPRTHATYGGSGLGLFISRQLAELHGGQIGVSSEDGVGSTFGFFIQGTRVPAPNRPDIMGRAPFEGGLKPPVSLVSMRSNSSPSRILSVMPETTPLLDNSDLSILVVEDNLVNQSILCKQLQKAGCIVYTADNGRLALDVIATTTFQDPAGRPLSIVLMDLEMPEMDGLTAVRRIRDMEAEILLMRHVPVIAVTANVRNEQIQAAIDGGMDDVVSKPFRVPELLVKIRSVLARLESG